MLHVLSAGAAKGLVGVLARADVQGVFSAVGAIRERFLAGEACDVLILTAGQLAELAASGDVVPDSVASIGTVWTAVAVPAGHAVPPMATGVQLEAALRAASALFLPDPFKSTAGIHIRGVLDALGLQDEMAGKLRAFPNGETAMRTLAEEAPEDALGTTQITEILYTPGLTLVGKLPPEYGLATVYAAAVSARAQDPAAAQALVTALTGPDSAALRLRSGFAEGE